MPTSRTESRVRLEHQQKRMARGDGLRPFVASATRQRAPPARTKPHRPARAERGCGRAPRFDVHLTPWASASRPGATLLVRW